MTELFREWLLLIRSAIFILIWSRFIPGGRIVLRQERKNAADGGFIIFYVVKKVQRAASADAGAIHTEVFGSNHCPVELILAVKDRKIWYTQITCNPSLNWCYRGEFLDGT